MKAKRKGQKLAYEGKSEPIYSMADVAPGGVPSRKMKSGDKVSQERIKTGLGKGNVQDSRCRWVCKIL